MDVVENGEQVTERRGRVIVELVERYQVESEPDKWLQAFTINALRALGKSNVGPAEKGPARREIHAISREVVSKAKSLTLSRVLRDNVGAVKKSMTPSATVKADPATLASDASLQEGA